MAAVLDEVLVHQRGHRGPDRRRLRRAAAEHLGLLVDEPDPGEGIPDRRDIGHEAATLGVLLDAQLALPLRALEQHRHTPGRALRQR